MQRIPIQSGVPYTVLVGRGLLPNCATFIANAVSARHAVVVTDDNVDRLYADTVLDALRQDGFQVDKFVFPNGEQSKSHETLLKLYAFLSDRQITRKDFLIALGGGVVGDLTGFAAATYLRGIDYIQIPTTLLAQIDSSVGGKTAVDIEAGKNLVGAFLQPKLVLCDVDTLSTLSDKIFSDGMAEAIKYGAIRDAALFDRIFNRAPDEEMTEIITRCIQIKAEIVKADEFDFGERMLLNFGHTFAHGIEKYYHYETYTHGSAVAIGMALMARLCARYRIAKPEDCDRLIACIRKYNLPTETELTPDALIPCCLNDKKRLDDALSIIVLKQIGHAEILKLSVEDFKTFARGESCL